MAADYTKKIHNHPMFNSAMTTTVEENQDFSMHFAIFGSVALVCELLLFHMERGSSAPCPFICLHGRAGTQAANALEH